MATQISIINEALQYIGEQTLVVALTDIPAGVAANTVYTPIVQMLLRQLDPDFARRSVSLVIVSGGGTGFVNPFTYEYTYPADCVRLRQLAPPMSGAGALADPFDPQPIRGIVGLDIVSGTNVKAIFTNQQNAIAFYTSSNVTEAQFDSVFIETLVRQLANPLAMALAGRPDYAKEILETAARYEQMAELVDESMAR